VKPPPIPKPRTFVTYKTDEYRVFMVRRNKRVQEAVRAAVKWAPMIILYLIIKYVLYRLGVIHSMK